MAGYSGPTAGILNGTDLLVYDGANPLMHATDCSIQLSMGLRDTSTKLSSGWKTSLAAQRSWTGSSNGLVALDAVYNLLYLQNLIINRTLVTLNFKTQNVADFYYQGTAWLTACSVTAPNNNNVTYQASFEGTGPLVLMGSGLGEIPSPDGVLNITDAATISGANQLYTLNKATAFILTLDHITNIANKIPIVNQGLGFVTIVSTDGLLIDGHSEIGLVSGQSITIFPNETKFEVKGTYTIPE